MKNKKTFLAPIEMIEADEKIDQTLSQFEDKETVVTYKKELDKKKLKENLVFVLVFFIFSFLLSAGNTAVAVICTLIFASTRTWRKIDKTIQFDHKGNVVSVNGVPAGTYKMYNENIEKRPMGKITSITQLNKEQLAKFEMAKDLALHLHKVGQIKEKPTEEQMEQYFLKRLNNDLTVEGV